MGRILIVDDEPSIVAVLLQFLHKKGYKVAGVTTPELAEEIACSVSFDLIIMDINLGTVRGTELIGKLMEKGFTGEVLYITAYSENYLEELGVVDSSKIVNKPFKLNDILKRVRERTGNVNAG